MNFGLGVVRNKVLALILGPGGVGLLGVYGSVQDLMRSVAGLGINTSGVRQIAEAVGTGDEQRIARTVTILRRVAFCSGVLGALLLLILSKPVSWLTFKDYQHAGAVALLALAIFFGDVSQGQAALVQGMRRIADLARMSVLGALYGTLFSIVIIYYYYRQGAAEKGVVPSLVCVAGMSILTSWWYARKIKVKTKSLSLRQMYDETSALLKLGIVFMATGLMGFGSAYLVRVLILHRLDLQAAGFYQSAWMVGGYYITFILQAMGTDFYPRLTAVARNHAECNRLVNEQTEVGLLLAGPGVIATLIFAPLVIQLFYSAKFWPAAELLRWFCLGMMLRVADWPMGYVLVARGDGKLFFLVEFLSNALFMGLVWVGLHAFGLNGTGMAFVALYLLHIIGMYWITRRLTGFRWSAANRWLLVLLTPLVAAAFVSRYLLAPPIAMICGALLTVLTGIYSLKKVYSLVPPERLPGMVRKIITFFRLVPPQTGN